MYQATKRRLAGHLHVGGGRLGVALDGAIAALIVLNVIAVVVGTVDGIDARYGSHLSAFQFVSIGLFSLEYVARVWTAPEREGYEGAIVGRLRFMSRPYMLVDLLAILPFYVWLLTGSLALADLRVLRAIRLFWFLKLLGRTRYGAARRTFVRVLKRKREDLSIAFTGAAIAIVVSSSLLYYVEHRVQPAAFSSIPEALWWGTVTLTTVGYGDVVPVTPIGKLLAGLTAFGGIAFVGLPASILAAGFVEESMLDSEAGGDADPEPGPAACPHCGEPIGADDRSGE